MKTNFINEIDRSNTYAAKWDVLPMKTDIPNAIPMWIADGDVRSPIEVENALKARAQHPIYGYSFPPEEFKEITAMWMKKRHNWKIENEWVMFCPGIVRALHINVMAFTNEGDEVIIQRPVYYPFGLVVEKANRKILDNSLIYKDDKYTIDFENLEELASRPNAKMMILCNPHNPVGRVFTKEELEKIGDICDKYNVVIVSDEIHADLILYNNKHIPMANLDKTWAKNIITCHAPSKTFNIAGLEGSCIIAENEEYRVKINKAIDNAYFNMPNVFTMPAYITAYRDCEYYVNDILELIESNIKIVENTLKETMPKIKLVKPEGTYLLWLDCTEFNIQGEELEEFFNKKAGVVMNGGYMFGEQGNNFMRMNVCCPQSILKRALSQMKTAYDEL